MIGYAAAPSAPPPPAIEVDPVRIIARAMRELAAQGRTVDRAAILAWLDADGGGITGADIDAHGAAAADLARAWTREAA